MLCYFLLGVFGLFGFGFVDFLSALLWREGTDFTTYDDFTTAPQHDDYD